MEDLTRTQFIQLMPEDLGETASVKDVIASVYAALTEKGYNPVNQIVGYIMSGDPTYITSHKNARSHDHEGRAGRACGGDAPFLYPQCGMEQDGTVLG